MFFRRHRCGVQIAVFRLRKQKRPLKGPGRNGRLAQLVERLVYTEDVGSSSLSSPTIPSPPRICELTPSALPKHAGYWIHSVFMISLWHKLDKVLRLVPNKKTRLQAGRDTIKSVGDAMTFATSAHCRIVYRGRVIVSLRHLVESACVNTFSVVRGFSDQKNPKSHSRMMMGSGMPINHNKPPRSMIYSPRVALVKQERGVRRLGSLRMRRDSSLAVTLRWYASMGLSGNAGFQLRHGTEF